MGETLDCVSFFPFSTETHIQDTGQEPSSLLKEGKCWSAVGNSVVLLLQISKKVQ